MKYIKARKLIVTTSFGEYGYQQPFFKITKNGSLKVLADGIHYFSVGSFLFEYSEE